MFFTGEDWKIVEGEILWKKVLQSGNISPLIYNKILK